MSVVKHAEKKKEVNPYLPIIGLVLAIAVGALAYALEGYAFDFLMENVTDFSTAVAAEPDNELYFHIVLGAIMWFIMFTIALTLVIAAIPKNIVEDEYGTLPPTKYASQKEIKEWEKKQAKLRKEKIKAVKRLKKKKEREQRRRN